MNFLKNNIIIVDDDKQIRGLLYKCLTRGKYNCFQAATQRETEAFIKNNEIDLVLLDIKLQGEDGFAILHKIKSEFPDIMVIMISGEHDINMAIKAMQEGAIDYVKKPFNLSEVLMSVNNALEKRELILQNKNYQNNLENMVQEQAERIREAFLNSITSLSIALESKDQYTHGHSQRVTGLSEAIVGAMNALSDKKGKNTLLEKIHLGGILHDIGKIGIREKVLHKPGKLDDLEYAIIKNHPLVGTKILSPVIKEQEVLDIVLHHHEHFNGKGYPDGLAGNAIPLAARVVAVADAYDAMTSDRPYRKALKKEQALEELTRCSGEQFDPEVVNAFRRIQ